MRLEGERLICESQEFIVHINNLNSHLANIPDHEIFLELFADGRSIDSCRFRQDTTCFDVIPIERNGEAVRLPLKFSDAVSLVLNS